MATQIIKTSKAKYRTGAALSTLAVLFLVLDGVMKLVKPQPVLDACVRLGLPVSLCGGIGVVLLLCTLLYAVPRTAVMGAMLLTGYLGGAVFANVRVGEPMVTNTLFPVYFGVLVWAGLVLRDVRVWQAILRAE